MRRVGLKNYLTDRRFTAEKCSFEIYGYPQNYGSAVTQNTGSQSSQCSNCYMPQYQNSYPATVNCVPTLTLGEVPPVPATASNNSTQIRSSVCSVIPIPIPIVQITANNNSTPTSRCVCSVMAGGPVSAPRPTSATAATLPTPTSVPVMPTLVTC